MVTLPRGVALIAVLSVLTALALLAAAFAVMMNLESASGRTMMGKLQADMLAGAALEHVQALLREDAWTQPAWDDYSEAWARAVRAAGNDGVDLDGLPGRGGGAAEDGRWFNVYNPDETLLGRYAVMIEDECGKINIKYAAALRAEQQHQGIGAFEVLLTDGKGRGLPLSLQMGEKMLGYRYGRDGKPGQAGVDDNFTAMTYEHDGIDNNANGVIDEANEGVDEQEEYDAVRPRWDDRAFTSVREALDLAARGRDLSAAAYRGMRRVATVVSRGRTLYQDPGDGQW